MAFAWPMHTHTYKWILVYFQMYVCISIQANVSGIQNLNQNQKVTFGMYMWKHRAYESPHKGVCSQPKHRWTYQAASRSILYTCVPVHLRMYVHLCANVPNVRVFCTLACGNIAFLSSHIRPFSRMPLRPKTAWQWQWLTTACTRRHVRRRFLCVNRKIKNHKIISGMNCLRKPTLHSAVTSPQ